MLQLVRVKLWHTKPTCGFTSSLWAARVRVRGRRRHQLKQSHSWSSAAITFESVLLLEQKFYKTSFCALWAQKEEDKRKKQKQTILKFCEWECKLSFKCTLCKKVKVFEENLVINWDKVTLLPSASAGEQCTENFEVSGNPTLAMRSSRAKFSSDVHYLGSCKARRVHQDPPSQSLQADARDFEKKQGVGAGNWQTSEKNWAGNWQTEDATLDLPRCMLPMKLIETCNLSVILKENFGFNV